MYCQFQFLCFVHCHLINHTQTMLDYVIQPISVEPTNCQRTEQYSRIEVKKSLMIPKW